MKQDKIGNLIRDLRIKKGLTQRQFAEIYNVSYQAVSKWETGKSIPDITLLKKIAEDFEIDINNLLDGKIDTKTNKNNKKMFTLVIILGSIILLTSILIFIHYMNNHTNFEFKTLSSNCSNFKITGSISYNSSKSFIYITNIEYCGGIDNNIYQKIECSLYEENNNIKKELTKNNYQDKNISLENFLKDLELKVDYFSKACRYYQNNSLYLEINATDLNNQVIYYKIPLKMHDCN